MFQNCPPHILKTIFSRVLYVDLFETARVSQEWWTLTMASFDRLLSEEDDFLRNQIGFFKEMVADENQLEYWMFMEYTKSKRLHLKQEQLIELVSGPSARLITHYESKGVIVHHLIIDMSTEEDSDPWLGLPTNLNQLFPDLISLELVNAKFRDASSLILPEKLTYLQLSAVKFSHTSNLCSILLKRSTIRGLHIDNTRNIVFDDFHFENLTRLSFSANGQPNDFRLAPMLKSVSRGCKKLQSIVLKHVTISQEWVHILPRNVVKVDIQCPVLTLDIQQVFGKDVFYERLLLMFICKDWESVKYFRTSSLKLERNQTFVSWADLNFDLGCGPVHLYSADYVCKPTKREEQISIEALVKDCDIKRLIAKNNEGLALTTLHIKKLPKMSKYVQLVPRTVRELSINTDHRENELLEDLFEDCTLIEKVTLYKYSDLAEKFIGFPQMINLKELEIHNCDTHELSSILNSCTSLEKLTIKDPQGAIFSKLSTQTVHTNLSSLVIFHGRDTIDDILQYLPYLQSLCLRFHCSFDAILKSDLNLVNRLQYFKASTHRNIDVAYHLSKLLPNFEYVMFASSPHCDCYALSKRSKLVSEISNLVNGSTSTKSFILGKEYNAHKLALVYSKNISTRFLLKSCSVGRTVDDYIDELKRFGAK